MGIAKQRKKTRRATRIFITALFTAEKHFKQVQRPRLGPGSMNDTQTPIAGVEGNPHTPGEAPDTQARRSMWAAVRAPKPQEETK